MAEQEFTILLVDATAQSASALRELLRQSNYRLEIAEHRDTALRKLSDLKPHALLIGSVDPGDDIALGAAAEIAGVPTLSGIKDAEKVVERLKALLAPYSKKKIKTETKLPVVDQKGLDHLAVELVDEISDRDEVLDISAKPSEQRKPIRESSSGSDGVTQILGLLEINKEDDSGVSPLKKMGDAKVHERKQSVIESSFEESASLFALAVNSGREAGASPLVTRVAKPHLDSPAKEEPPLESSIFTPPGAVKEPPKETPKPIEKAPKTKNLNPEPVMRLDPTPREPSRLDLPRIEPPKLEAPRVEMPRLEPQRTDSMRLDALRLDPSRLDPAKKAEAQAPKIPKEETRRIFAPNTKDVMRPVRATPPEVPSEERPSLKETPRLPTPIAALSLSAPTPFPSDLLPLSPTPWSEEPPIVRNARFLHELLLQKESGVVTSRANNFTRTLSIANGVVLQATSNAPEEQFASILYREGKLTRAQLEELRALGDSTSDEVAKLIYRKGFARRAELESARRRYREEIFASLLEGKCDLQSKEVGLPAPQEKPFSGLLVSALRRRLSAQEARRLLQSATLSEASCPVCKRDLLGLSAQELAALQRINGQAGIEEIVGDLSPDLMLPLLVSLEVIGVIQIAGRVIKDDEDQQERLLERARIEGKYEEVILSDYFTLLGVSRRATLYEIQRAHQALSQAFHPDRFRAPQYADLLPRLAEIQDVLNDALFVLSDEARRGSYASRLVE